MKIFFSRTVYYLGKKLLHFEVELILHEFEVYFSYEASRLSYVDVCKFVNVCWNSAYKGDKLLLILFFTRSWQDDCFAILLSS